MTSLKSGNERFVAGKAQPKDFPSERLKVIKDQQPYAIVLACSDSQVPPEILFDESLGKLFVVRTAGHVVDPVALGSIEYAVKNLGVQMLLVMGHDGCSAVKATINGGDVPTNIRSLMQRIRPAVAKAHKVEFGPEDRLRNAILENVRYQMQMAMYESDLLADAVKGGHLTIAGGVYNPSSGKVNVISTLLAVDRNPDRQPTDHLASGHDAHAPVKAVQASHNEHGAAPSHGDSHAADKGHGAPAGHGETRTAAASAAHGSSHAPANSHAAPAHDAHAAPAHDAHAAPAHAAPAHDAHAAPAHNAHAAPAHDAHAAPAHNAHAAPAHDAHAAPAHNAHAAPAHAAASHDSHAAPAHDAHAAAPHKADSHKTDAHGAPAHKAEPNHGSKGHDAEEHHAEPKDSAHGKAKSHSAPKATHAAARSHRKGAKSAHASAGHHAVKSAKAPAKASAKAADAHGKGHAEESHKPAAKHDSGHGKKAEGGHRAAEKGGHGEKHAEKPAKTEKKSVKSDKGHGDHSYVGDDEDDEVLSLAAELQEMGWGITFVDGAAKNNIAEAINRFSKQISELQMSKILTSW